MSCLTAIITAITISYIYGAFSSLNKISTPSSILIPKATLDDIYYHPYLANHEAEVQWFTHLACGFSELMENQRRECRSSRYCLTFKACVFPVRPTEKNGLLQLLSSYLCCSTFLPLSHGVEDLKDLQSQTAWIEVTGNEVSWFKSFIHSLPMELAGWTEASWFKINL